MNGQEPVSRRIVSFVLCALTAAAGCSGLTDHGSSDPGNGSGNSENWSIGVAASRTTLSMEQGASDAVTLTVTRSGGFTGPVTFSVTGLPGATTVVSNETTTGTTTTALLTVSVPITQPVTSGAQILVLVRSPTDAVQGKSISLSVSVTQKLGIGVTTSVALSIGRGAPGTNFPVTLTRTGYDGPITMSLVLGSAPAGITATFAPNPVTGTSAVGTLQADNAVPEGSYSIGVRGSGGGFEGVATMAVTVTAPPAISLSVAPTSLTIARTASGQAVVTLTRTNYTGLVSFTLLGAPGDVTRTFTPTETTGTTTTLTLTPTAAAHSGTFAFTIRATGPGVTAAETPITLIVPP